MPYITPETRATLFDQHVNALIAAVRLNKNEDGDLNYIISRIVAGSLKPQQGWRYAVIARAVAVFECAKLEFYNRIAVPYEKQAAEKNGDIEEYKNV